MEEDDKAAERSITKSPTPSNASSDEDATPAEGRMRDLDELLAVTPHLAPAWRDSLAIRGLRAGLATGHFLSGMGEPTAIHRAQLEKRVKIAGSPRCRMLIFAPADKDFNEERGVLVHFHGGGWSMCYPELESEICQHYANQLKCLVVAPDYAKAPEHYWPHALRQAYGILKWISADDSTDSLSRFLKKHGDEMKRDLASVRFNRKAIAVSGGSSGGNIAAALALLLQKIPLDNDAKLVAVALQYPGLDLSKEYDHKLATLSDQSKIMPPPWASKLFLRCFLPKPFDTAEVRKNPYISPGLANDEQLRVFPPTRLVTSQYDHFREETQDFAARLSDLKVPSDLWVLPDVSHAFDVASHGMDEEQKKANARAREQSWSILTEHLSEYL